MSAELMRAGRVLLIRLKGTVSLETMLHAGSKARAEWDKGRHRSAVFDLSEASFDMTPTQWERSFSAAARWHFVPSMPMAVVAAPETFDFFLARSMRWAQHGVMQTVFMSLSDALAWGEQVAPPKWPSLRRS